MPPDASGRRTPRSAGIAGLLAGVAMIGCLLAAAPSRSQPPAEKPSTSVSTCITAACHADLVRSRVLHGPVAQQKCEACHLEVEPRDHRFALAGEADGLCRTCHVLPERTFTHTPVREGQCTGCHDPHGSDQPHLLVDDPTGGLCLSCHAETAGADMAFVHGPVAIGGCILCHEPHSAWRPALLTREPRDLCLDCHREMVPDPARDRHRHAPVEETCLSCHDPHASNVRHNLRRDAPDLCFDCHGDVRDALGSGPVVHGAATQSGGCLGCHDAHYSTLPALQKRTEIDQCLSCHDQPIPTADGRTLTDMGALLSENPYLHGPIRDGACTTCHRPHAAAEANLLRLAYPGDFYAPFEPQRYALCFECHLPEMVGSRYGTGLTRFRDGDVNLHWLHVHRDKGRTCRACHEVHASRHPFHIRDSVPFGSSGWALEIGFDQSETGGRCAPGCHAPRAYSRDAGGASLPDAPRRPGGGS